MKYITPRVLLATIATAATALIPIVTFADTTYTLPNPFGSNTTTPTDVIVNIINFAVGIIGIIALVMFIYGGFVILTAHGNAEQMKKGMHTLVYAIIGMVVVLTSYSVLSYIFTNVFNFTNS